MTYSPRFYSHTLSNVSKFFRCRIFGYGMLSLYFFNNLLDILIGIDRISIFLSIKLNKFHKLNPYMLCSILFVVCFGINSSFVFGYEISDDEKYFTMSNVVSYCNLNEFGKSRTGFILNMVVIFIRDIVTLILEITCSIMVVYYYIKYFRMSYFRTFIMSNSRENTIGLNSVQNRQQNLNIYYNNLIEKQKKGKKLLLMTIILLVIAVITHLLVAVVYVFLVNVYFENSYVYYTIVMFASISVVIKHFVSIFLLYFFNLNFKKQFKMIFKILSYDD
jgi:hypothetical protein